MAEWGKVDKVTERMKLTDKGELVKMYHIEATSTKGISFTVDVRAEELEEEVVTKALEERATQLDALLEL